MHIKCVDVLRDIHKAIGKDLVDIIPQDFPDFDPETHPLAMNKLTTMILYIIFGAAAAYGDEMSTIQRVKKGTINIRRYGELFHRASDIIQAAARNDGSAVINSIDKIIKEAVCVAFTSLFPTIVFCMLI